MELPIKGIATTSSWMMASDGDRYMAFYSSHWQIITDKNIPINSFHSRERWTLLAFNNDEIVAMFPGCQVSGFVVGSCPMKTQSTPHKADEPDNPPGIFNLDTGIGIH